jgi:iron complex transport system substrate-binding protein
MKINESAYPSILYLFFLIGILVIMPFAGCVQKAGNDKNRFPDQILVYHSEVQFAERFRVEYFTDYKKISVIDPWQGAENIEMSYYLVSSGERPAGLPEEQVIHVPVKRIICTSTTHIGMLDFLGKLETLVGVSGEKYINNPVINDRIDRGTIIDIGYDQNMNYEKIIALDPDLIVTYGVGSEIAGFVGKLKDLGIPVLINGDYLEQSPLAKSEWIKVMALLFGMEEEVEYQFNHIVNEYLEIKGIAAKTDYSPTVMIGLPWKDTWYVPGASSFAANFIKDAGGSYIWQHKHTNEAIPFNIEAVFEQARGADIWINPGSAGSLNEILDLDERLSAFNPIKQQSVYNNNRRLNDFGGNDYWESGIMQPQVILKDLIKIFHPDLLSGHRLVYYQKLK